MPRCSVNRQFVSTFPGCWLETRKRRHRVSALIMCACRVALSQKIHSIFDGFCRKKTRGRCGRILTVPVVVPLPAARHPSSIKCAS